MPVHRFKAEDVRRVVEHSIAAPKQSEQVVEYVPHTTKPIAAPAVLLVHDQGVYLVSNGKPRDDEHPGPILAAFVALSSRTPSISRVSQRIWLSGYSEDRAG